MSLLRRITAAALAGGVAAGLVWFALQTVWVTPLIHRAETYESHRSNDLPTQGTVEASGNAAPSATPWHWAPAGGYRRAGLTLAADLLAAIGFALLLVAGMTLAGPPFTLTRGLLWGLAGYAAFMLAPSLGLPPELPGAATAALGARQLWWTGTVLASAAGLAALAFAPGWTKLLGVALLAAPHAIGAPVAPLELPELQPPALAAHFVAAVLVTGAAFWALLGVTCAWMLDRVLADRIR